MIPSIEEQRELSRPAEVAMRIDAAVVGSAAESVFADSSVQIDQIVLLIR